MKYRFMTFWILPLCLPGIGLTTENIRPAARAGQFYPDSRVELESTIQVFLDDAESIPIPGIVAGLWVPHAGYVFSGQIAGNAYRLVQGMEYETVVIIGPSHYARLDGAAVGEWSGYRTPLGIVKVDTQLVKEFVYATPLISHIAGADRYEHSVEVQVPFIQKVLPGVPIVPMVIDASLGYSDVKKIAKALAAVAKSRNILFVASSDMSHFPSYKDAYEIDLRVLDKVADYDARGVIEFNDAIMREDVPGLDCALCGSSALVAVMLTMKELKVKHVNVLPYANSGDVSGERHRVVGYGAAVFYREESVTKGGKGMVEEVALTVAEKKILFRVARKSIEAALQAKSIPDFDIPEGNLTSKHGVFVTLTNKGRLRGCIGHFAPDELLWQLVSRMSVAAATQDYRFAYNPVTYREMPEIDIKISILSDLVAVESIEEIEIGKHGIWVVQGGRSGTYLPEVATEMGWDRVEFLEHCCVEKAGLSPDAWKGDADIYVYSSQILDEKDF